MKIFMPFSAPLNLLKLSINILLLLSLTACLFAPENKNSVKYQTKLAERGDLNAQRLLAQIYWTGGLGTQQSYEKSAAWRERAALQGDPTDQFQLAEVYASGRGVTRSYETAAQWYGKAAEQNHPEAQYRLGMLYHNGIGVRRDGASAKQWLEKASNNGSYTAQKALATHYPKPATYTPERFNNKRNDDAYTLLKAVGAIAGAVIIYNALTPSDSNQQSSKPKPTPGYFERDGECGSISCNEKDTNDYIIDQYFSPQ